MSTAPAPTPADDLRLIKEQVENASKLLTERIEAHDKRILDRDVHSERLLREIEQAKAHVDSRSSIFGYSLAGSLAIGVLLLMIFLYASVAPIAQGVATTAANRIDWDKEIAVAVDAELSERLSKEALAKVIDEKKIQEAAATVVDTESFKSMLRGQVESSVKQSVGVVVTEMIADSNAFQSIIAEQLRIEQSRYQAALKGMGPIEAPDRATLAKNLLTAIGEADRLGRTWTYIQFYPFDDVLHVNAKILWQPQQPKNERVKVYEIAFEGMTATTDERRETVERYLDQPVPASVPVKRGDGPNGSKFVTGEFNGDTKAQFATYDEASQAIVENVIDLVDDSFKIDYPTTWRVTIGQ